WLLAGLDAAVPPGHRWRQRVDDLLSVRYGGLPAEVRAALAAGQDGVLWGAAQRFSFTLIHPDLAGLPVRGPPAPDQAARVAERVRDRGVAAVAEELGYLGLAELGYAAHSLLQVRIVLRGNGGRDDQLEDLWQLTARLHKRIAQSFTTLDDLRRFTVPAADILDRLPGVRPARARAATGTGLDTESVIRAFGEAITTMHKSTTKNRGRKEHKDNDLLLDDEHVEQIVAAAWETLKEAFPWIPDIDISDAFGDIFTYVDEPMEKAESAGDKEWFRKEAGSLLRKYVFQATVVRDLVAKSGSYPIFAKKDGKPNETAEVIDEAIRALIGTPGFITPEQHKRARDVLEIRRNWSGTSNRRTRKFYFPYWLKPTRQENLENVIRLSHTVRHEILHLLMVDGGTQFAARFMGSGSFDFNVWVEGKTSELTVVAAAGVDPREKLWKVLESVEEKVARVQRAGKLPLETWMRDKLRPDPLKSVPSPRSYASIEQALLLDLRPGPAVTYAALFNNETDKVRLRLPELDTDKVVLRGPEKAAGSSSAPQTGGDVSEEDGADLAAGMLAPYDGRDGYATGSGAAGGQGGGAWQELVAAVAVPASLDVPGLGVVSLLGDLSWRDVARLGPLVAGKTDQQWVDVAGPLLPGAEQALREWLAGVARAALHVPAAGGHLSGVAWLSVDQQLGIINDLFAGPARVMALEMLEGATDPDLRALLADATLRDNLTMLERTVPAHTVLGRRRDDFLAFRREGSWVRHAYPEERINLGRIDPGLAGRDVLDPLTPELAVRIGHALNGKSDAALLGWMGRLSAPQRAAFLRWRHRGLAAFRAAGPVLEYLSGDLVAAVRGWKSHVLFRDTEQLAKAIDALLALDPVDAPVRDLVLVLLGKLDDRRLEELFRWRPPGYTGLASPLLVLLDTSFPAGDRQHAWLNGADGFFARNFAGGRPALEAGPDQVHAVGGRPVRDFHPGLLSVALRHLDPTKPPGDDELAELGRANRGKTDDQIADALDLPPVAELRLRWYLRWTRELAAAPLRAYLTVRPVAELTLAELEKTLAGPAPEAVVELLDALDADQLARVTAGEGGRALARALRAVLLPEDPGELGDQAGNFVIGRFGSWAALEAGAPLTDVYPAVDLSPQILFGQRLAGVSFTGAVSEDQALRVAQVLAATPADDLLDGVAWALRS
ncbi:MAG: hypothetical protein ABSA93_40510, partial [Streptosporangiaceae bacterium]